MMKQLVLLVLLCATIYAQTCSPSQTIGRCLGATCGLDVHNWFTVNNTACAPCTWEDIGSRFTACYDTPSGSKKSLFYFWRPPATCLPSATVSSLPAPIRDLPCDLTCSQGTYFNSATSKCEQCAAGSYAVSQRVVIDKWDVMDPQMVSHCERNFAYGPSSGCSNWRLQSTYIDSGDNWNSHNMRSVLEFNVEISEPHGAYVEFEYKVNAESNYDFLTFSVDRSFVMRKDVQSEWATYRYNFTSQGFHNLAWAFQKDISYSAGEDLAKIRRIEIVGTSNFASRCTPCAAGTAGNGLVPCTPCAVGTYAPTEGMATCRNCPPSMTSFPGATSCYAANVPCTASDYFFDYTPCNPTSLKRTKTAKWIEPVLCNSTGIALPAPVEETCTVAECPAGKTVNPTTGACEYCPAGTASKGGSALSSCASCEDGSAADRKVYYVDKFVDRSQLNTGCTGECRSGGWRFAGSYMDSGIGNGISESYFSFNVEPASKASNVTLLFEYALSCKSGALEFSLDGILWDWLDCSGCQDINTFNVFKLEVPRSTKPVNVLVNYRTRTDISSDNLNCNRAVFRRVTVQGTDHGGSEVCDVCAAGTYSNNRASCDLCAAGTYSTLGSLNCTDCAANTFSRGGAGSCKACGNGTIATTSKSTKCSWQYGECSFNAVVGDVSRTFAWEALSDETFQGQYSAVGERGSRYYINLCSRDHPQCGSSFACKAVKTNEIMSLGDTVSISTFNDKSLGVRLALQTYDQAACFNNVTNAYSPVTTNIYMTCRPMGAPKQAYGPVITMIDQCTYDIQFYKAQACPLCTEDDWYPYTTDCAQVNGNWVTETRFLRKTFSANICSGGVDKSNSTSVESCIPYVKEAQNYWWVFGLVGAGALLLAIVVAIVAIVLFIRYRKLSSDFQRLRDDQDASNQSL